MCEPGGGREDLEVQRNGTEVVRCIPAIPPKKQTSKQPKNEDKTLHLIRRGKTNCASVVSPIFKLARSEPRSCRWLSHSPLLFFLGTELPGELDSLILSGTSPICPRAPLTQHGPHRVVAWSHFFPPSFIVRFVCSFLILVAYPWSLKPCSVAGECVWTRMLMVLHYLTNDSYFWCSKY